MLKCIYDWGGVGVEMLTDQDKWRIEQIINSCAGICEIGKLLHRLWGAYKDLENYIKIHEQEAWFRLQEKRREEEDEI